MFILVKEIEYAIVCYWQAGINYPFKICTTADNKEKDQFMLFLRVDKGCVRHT